jgi:hypothetical protein
MTVVVCRWHVCRTGRPQGRLPDGDGVLELALVEHAVGHGGSL